MKTTINLLRKIYMVGGLGRKRLKKACNKLCYHRFWVAEV